MHTDMTRFLALVVLALAALGAAQGARAQALSTEGGLVPVGIYLGAAALISLVALIPLKHQQA